MDEISPEGVFKFSQLLQKSWIRANLQGNVGSECRFSNMALTFILRKFFDTYLSSLGDHIQGLSEYAITDEGKGKLKRFAGALFSC